MTYRKTLPRKTSQRAPEFLASAHTSRLGSVIATLLPDFASRAQNVTALDARLRGEDPVFDFERDSLQKRLLGYFQAELGYKGARKHLEEAETGRRGLQCEVETAGLLGLHSGNKELHRFVEGLANSDLYLLQSVVIAENPSARLRDPEIIETVTRQLRVGRGEDVVCYLAARLEHHRRRLIGKPQTMEVFNPVLAVIAGMWTHPDCPLWLMPSAGAVEVINGAIEKPLTTAAYNRLVSGHKLHRIHQRVLDMFLAVERRDARCIELRGDLESVAGISLATVTRGRRAGT